MNILGPGPDTGPATFIPNQEHYFYTTLDGAQQPDISMTTINA